MHLPEACRRSTQGPKWKFKGSFHPLTNDFLKGFEEFEKILKGI